MDKENNLDDQISKRDIISSIAQQIRDKRKQDFDIGILDAKVKDMATTLKKLEITSKVLSAKIQLLENRLKEIKSDGRIPVVIIVVVIGCFVLLRS